MDLKIWVLSAAVTALAIVVWWVIQQGIKGIYARLDELIRQNRELGLEMTKHSGELKGISEKLMVHETRINKHSERINRIELEHAKCFKQK
jgi:low affinity Fe/Cu permease